MRNQSDGSWSAMGIGLQVFHALAERRYSPVMRMVAAPLIRQAFVNLPKCACSLGNLVFFCSWRLESACTPSRSPPTDALPIATPCRILRTSIRRISYVFMHVIMRLFIGDSASSVQKWYGNVTRPFLADRWHQYIKMEARWVWLCKTRRLLNFHVNWTTIHWQWHLEGWHIPTSLQD